MGENKKLIESIERWRNIVVLNAKNDSLNAFSDAIVSSSPDIDKMSGWALGAAGAIAGLMIANIDKIGIKFYDVAEIKVMLLTLTISILCGLAQKSLAVSCAVHMKVKEVLSVKLKEIIIIFEESESSIEKMIEDHKLDVAINFDLAEVIGRFVELTPFYIKWLIKKETAKSMTNPEYSAKSILRKYYRQNTWLLMQTISFIGFILFAVQSL
jgi:VIT1/CCC1 family predicted Fe2+/Mn2+ transporter